MGNTKFWKQAQSRTAGWLTATGGLAAVEDLRQLQLASHHRGAVSGDRAGNVAKARHRLLRRQKQYLISTMLELLVLGGAQAVRSRCTHTTGGSPASASDRRYSVRRRSARQESH